jgi:hypothetical protein
MMFFEEGPLTTRVGQLTLEVPRGPKSPKETLKNCNQNLSIPHYSQPYRRGALHKKLDLMLQAAHVNLRFRTQTPANRRRAELELKFVLLNRNSRSYDPGHDFP